MMWLLQHYIPESPKWLLSQSDNSSDNAIKMRDEETQKLGSISQSRYAQAKAILEELRPEGFNVEQELQLIVDEIKLNEVDGSGASWAEVFSCRKAVIIGCGLMFFQAMTGINSVVFYSTTIFSLAGFSQSIIGTALFGIVNFLMTLLAANLIDKMGRKILLVGGTSVM
jgi:MFS family permease